ncbi:kinase-like domain-containing protein, partial [Cladorrhinum sp. PSN259]
MPHPHIPPRNYVHFDIDPQNILVGEYDNDPNSRHYGAPRLKITDFGLMEDAQPAALDNFGWVYPRRGRGKKGYLAPEQFTTEWGMARIQELRNIPPRRWKDVHPSYEPDVAGKYSHKTNIFQLGHVMYNIITRYRMPESPPEPVIYWHDPAHPFQAGHPPARTHAGMLLLDQHFGHVDPYLRDLVIRMMYENPDRRP